MSEVTTIKTGIKTRCSSVLGSGYSEMSYTMDVEKNSKGGNSSRYGVLAGALSQNEGRGVIGKYTVQQEYTIKLMTSYAPYPTKDSTTVSAIDTLLNQALAIYKDLINNQAGAPSLVTLVENLNIDEPTVVEGSNIVTVNMNVTITYRKVL